MSTVLAKNLPQASTFFLAYILLQGLTGTAGSFLLAVTLILRALLQAHSPRLHSVINRSVTRGTLFPSTTLFVVIGLG